MVVIESQNQTFKDMFDISGMLTKKEQHIRIDPSKHSLICNQISMAL